MHNTSPTVNIQLVALIFCVPAGVLMAIVGFAAPMALPVLMLALVLIWLCATVCFQRAFDWSVDNFETVVNSLATAGVFAAALHEFLFTSSIPAFPLAQRRLSGVDTLPTPCLTARLLPAPILHRVRRRVV